MRRAVAGKPARMAELEPIHEKYAEVLGLAQAAQAATSKVAQLAEGEQQVQRLLERMNEEAGETRRRAEEGLDSFAGRKTAIEEKARETRHEATQMMETYLGGDSDELDGFEFLTMAEAGELGHLEILQAMNERVQDATVRELTEFAIPIQQRHFTDVRECSLELAREEVAA